MGIKRLHRGDRLADLTGGEYHLLFPPADDRVTTVKKAETSGAMGKEVDDDEEE